MRPVALWGDSIGKGVVFDENRSRYVILKENCIAMLSERLGITVENHAVMGCTVSKAKSRFSSDLMIPGGVAVFEFGGNDSDMPWAQISQAPEGVYEPKTTLDEFAVELSDMVQGARQGGMTPLLVTPMPVVSSRYFRWITRSLNADAVLRWLGDVEHIYRWQERYAAAVRDVARETHAHLLDLRDAFLRVGPLEKYFCADGIHPNEEGHRLMFECVRSFVTEGWKQARVNASVPA